jgi:lipopolysaccharide/colanic/teichoic acid biosynthesis glycosyltransferase
VAEDRATDVRADPISKRAFDIFFSAIGLVVTAPLWPFVALAAKFQGPGPIFFRQQRWGRGGTRFEVVKFRTMTPSADTDPIRPTSAGDVRVTSVGRVLRKMGLDELPQLISILKGDMSFVGPRPLAVGEEIVDPEGKLVSYEDVPGFAERLSVRPGLTGATTVYVPRDSSPMEKFEADLRYIEQRTFAGDLRLFLVSIANSVGGRWDRGTRKV